MSLKTKVSLKTKEQFEEERKKARAFLLNRQRAYRKLFAGRGKDTKEVMNDLIRFCRGKSSCFHEDPRMHAVLEGRREVLLRIQDHLELDTDELLNLYMGETNE